MIIDVKLYRVTFRYEHHSGNRRERVVILVAPDSTIALCRATEKFENVSHVLVSAQSDIAMISDTHVRE